MMYICINQWRIQDFYTNRPIPMEILYKLGSRGEAGKSWATIFYRKSNKLSFIFTSKRKAQPRVSVDFYQTSPKSSRRSQERGEKMLSITTSVSFLPLADDTREAYRFTLISYENFRLQHHSMNSYKIEISFSRSENFLPTH